MQEQPAPRETIHAYQPLPSVATLVLRGVERDGRRVTVVEVVDGTYDHPDVDAITLYEDTGFYPDALCNNWVDAVQRLLDELE